jgi:hypothetical protein
MAIHETGHARNVEMFESMIAYITSLGAAYDPPSMSIDLATLTTKHTACKTAVENVTASVVPYKVAVNERETAYAPLKKLATQIINIFIAGGAPANAVEDARGYVRKIQGQRKSKPKVDDPNTPEDESLQNHSASQQSYTQQVENFDALIALIESYSHYSPTEPALQISALKGLSAQLKLRNTAVAETRADLSVVRMARNDQLYHPDLGLVARANRSKNYVKGAFGSTSPQYKQIAAFNFKTRKV